MSDPQRPDGDAPLSKRAKLLVQRSLRNPDDSSATHEPESTTTIDSKVDQSLVPPPVCLPQSVNVSTVLTALTSVSSTHSSTGATHSTFEVSHSSEIYENVGAPSENSKLSMPQSEGENSKVVIPIIKEAIPEDVVQLPTQQLPIFSNLLLPTISSVRPGAAPAMDISNFFIVQCADDVASEAPSTPPPSPPSLDPEQPPSPSHLTSPSASEQKHTSEGLPGTLPLFHGSPITAHDCMVSILTYAQANHLSGTSTCELIRLLEILLPQPNNLPKSTTLFKKYFKDNANELQMYFFCSNCWSSRISFKDICTKCSAPNRKVGYYITCSLEQQIQRLYARPGFCDLLQYRNNRKKENEANIEDIYDGNIYKEAQKDILSNPNNISFTWYTDGVQVFEVSTFDLWLSMLTINELPPEERFKSENVLITGIWGSDSKPHPNIFLLPTYHDIVKVNKGVSVKPHGSMEEITVCGYLLFGTCDCPAKSKFMNMKAHSGYYSCPKCCIKGEKSDRTGSVLVFPHDDKDLELRTDENFQACFNEGIKSKEGCKGVYGPSILYYMFSGPFIAGMAIDSMHSQFMGNMKLFLKLWFDEKYGKELFTLRDKIPVINERLRGLNLPHFVQRLPVDVDKNLCYFKASLCRNLFFYILPVVLYGVLKSEYYENYMKLVSGVALLNKSSISQEDRVRAELLLNEFSEEFQKLYGLRHMSSNIHAVRHLAKSVEDTGPLFLLGCFMYEDLNGKYIALVHGTRHVIIQISNHLGLLTDLPLLISNLESDSLKMYCYRSIRRSNNLTITEKISDHMYVIGKITDVSDHAAAIKSLVSLLYAGSSYNVRYFDRLQKNRLLYVSDAYKPGSRVSSYSQYWFNNALLHGKILKFVKVTSNSGTKYFAFIQRSKDIPVKIERFVAFSGTDDVDFVPVTTLRCVSFGLFTSENVYLVDPLNLFEME